MTDYDPTDETANEEREATESEALERIAKQKIEDLKWVMSDKRGRRFMWELLSDAGVFRNPFRGTPETDFLCGVMHLGQQFLVDINQHAPGRYNQMVTEQQK